MPSAPAAPPLRTGASAALGLLLLAAVALGARTDPVLALTAVSASGAGGAVLLRVEGELPIEDALQQEVAVQLLVHEMTPPGRFARYTLAGGAFEGEAAALADGLDAVEASALATTGAPAPAAAIVGLAPQRVDLLLPASFPAGAARVVAFFVDAEGVILSNALPLVVPQRAP